MGTVAVAVTHPARRPKAADRLRKKLTPHPKGLNASAFLDARWLGAQGSKNNTLVL
jgi:hypothetical protein